MTKPFKLRLRLSPFQLCRSISSSVRANSRSASIGSSIPVNTEALETSIYPLSPAPPPSSPISLSSFKRNAASKIIPVGVDSGGDAYLDNMDTSPAYMHDFTSEKLYNSPADFGEFESSLWPIASSDVEKSHKEESIWLKDQSATSFAMSVSSPTHSRWFSSEDEDDDDNVSEGQLSSCSSYSSFSDFGHPVKNPADHKCTNGNGNKIKKKEGKVRRPKMTNASNSWKDGDKIKVAKAGMMLRESGSFSGRKTVLGRLLPCGVDGKVNESYAVMKKSADPFDDFKMSMVEMIKEKQISEQEDLEKLLMCFLSLNAKDHHAVIVAAFTEVWQELYSSG